MKTSQARDRCAKRRAKPATARRGLPKAGRAFALNAGKRTQPPYPSLQNADYLRWSRCIEIRALRDAVAAKRPLQIRPAACKASTRAQRAEAMAETTQKRARDADAVDLTEDASPEKKHKVALNAIAKEFICPITQELPVDPVIAKDGKIYERDAILEWFRKKDGDATSPSTGKVIDTELVPVVQARNTIESLIQTGAIEDEIAEAWQKRLAFEKRVKEMRAKAEGGDGDAMHWMGVCYTFGQGVAKDEAQARAWYERSAAARNPKGLASFGDCLLAGTGGPQESVYGIINMTQAAELGSDWGAYRLGWAFFEGAHGLPKDPVRARFWIKKVVEGECTHKHLTDQAIAEAANWLRELDQ